MKARLEKITNADGTISEVVKIYPEIPSKFKHENGYVIGGGKALPEEELKSYGFLDLVTPEYDSRIEELSNLHLEGDVYTYDVIDKPIKETLTELKNIKLQEVNTLASQLLSITDWYIIRNIDSGEEIPEDVKNSRAEYRRRSNEIIDQINALTTKKQVLTFSINL